jgi:hypothetical protein
MTPLINDNGSINVHEVFHIKGSDKRLRIVGTTSTEKDEQSFKKSPWNAKDTVKNLDTGKLTEIDRRELYNKKPIIR